MGRARELPHSFELALRIAARLLSANHELVSRNLVDPEAEQLVIAAYRKATGKSLSRMELFARIRDRYPEAAGEALLNLAQLRGEGRLLQHLTGTQAFLDHEYEVTPDVLIPRPETEVLVSLAIERLARREPAIGFEIGLGSGAISIELLHRFPSLRMLATELSPGARAIAEKNAKGILGPARSRLEIVAVASPEQVLEPIAGAARADFLISNPPYLAAESELDPEVLRHEPHQALFAPPGDPLFFYRKIAEGARARLHPGAPVFLEVPHERASDLQALYERNGWKVELFKDLTGRERVLVAGSSL